MGSARDRQVREILEELEETLLETIPVAFRRSPETLLREVASLNLVIELKERLKSQNR